MTLYNKIVENRHKKMLFLLIDPDGYNYNYLLSTLDACKQNNIDMLLVGGSITSENTDKCVGWIKEHCNIPVLLFPGSLLQLSDKADGVLLLSLISGRNAEYLIGNHVIAAPYLRKTGIEVIPVGYILVENGTTTSVEYMSNTKPIPAQKTNIAVSTAIAGEMLGLKMLYLEAGSGALNHVPIEMIAEVRKNTTIPLIVGGGVRNKQQLQAIYNAGADIVVIGNAVENDLQKLGEFV